MKLSGMLADRSRARTTPGRVLPAVKEGMLRDFAKGNERRQDIIHPSELSHQATFCPRSVYIRIKEGPLAPTGFDFGLQNIFDEGHSIHAKWQDRLRRYTPLFGNWECKVCFTVERACTEPDPGLPCGYIDGCGTGHIWEYKEITLDAEDDALLAGHADGGFSETLVEFKGLALDTPLPTPSGWTTMGEVQVGDYLMGSDGCATKVMAKSEPRNIGTYIVEFEGGFSVTCDKEHLWKVLSGRSVLEEKVLGIDEIRDTLFHEGQRQHRVINAASLQLNEISLLADPYVIGAWLGDGTQRNGSAFVTGRDDEVFQQILDTGAILGNPNSVKENVHDRCVHGLVTALRELGIPSGVTSPNRWIPKRLLRASAGQRLALLQGMMDTDGTWMKKRNQAQFITTSPVLADDMVELLASLGQRPNTRKYTASGYGIVRDAYYVRWTPLGINPFRIPRKAVLVGNVSDLQKTRSSYRVIKSVTPGPDVTTQCVMVDSPDHTYLCGNAMIPTHNSVGTGTVRIEDPDLFREHGGDLQELWRGITWPFETHLNQGDIYLWICKQRGLPFTEVSYVYESKWNQQIKEFIVPYSEARSMKLIDQAVAIKYAVEHNEEPPCRFPGECKECKPYDARREPGTKRTVRERNATTGR